MAKKQNRAARSKAKPTEPKIIQVFDLEVLAAIFRDSIPWVKVLVRDGKVIVQDEPFAVQIEVDTGENRARLFHAWEMRFPGDPCDIANNLNASKSIGRFHGEPGQPGKLFCDYHLLPGITYEGVVRAYGGLLKSCIEAVKAVEKQHPAK